MSPSNMLEKSLVQAIASDLGVTEAYIEKDWYVVQVLAVLAQMHYKGFKLVFSGGTSLSKGYDLIQRFSEDIDFKVIPPDSTTTRKARSHYREAVVAALHSAFWTIDAISSRNQNRFFTIHVKYNPAFTPTSALRSYVKLEMTIDSPILPYEELPIRSFVALARGDAPEVTRIACVSPVETAADKLSALVWRVPIRQRGSERDDPSLVRHVHDLAALGPHVLANVDFSLLVIQVFEKDAHRGRSLSPMTALSRKDRIAYAMRILREDTAYHTEYDRFVQGMSYADESSRLSFAEALEIVMRIVEALPLTC